MMLLWISCLLIGSITCSPLHKEHELQGAPSAATDPVEVPLPYIAANWRRVSADVGSSSPQPSLPNPTADQITDIAAPGVSSAHPGSYSSSTTMAGGSGLSSGYTSFREPYYSPEVSNYGVNAAASHTSGYGSTAPSGGYVGGYDSSASGYYGSAPSGSYVGDYGSSASGYYGSAPSGGYVGGYDSSASGYYGSAPSGYLGSYDSSLGEYAGSSSYGYVAPHDEAGSSYAGGETPEPIFSDVSDLEPVYSFSSRSSYQHGRDVFEQTRYIPGEPAPPVMPISRESGPVAAPGKGGF